jgi:acyl carrier protein
MPQKYSRRAALTRDVAAAVNEVLGCSPSHDAILMASGLDSLGSEELLVELGKLGRIELAAHELFVAYPSIEALVTYLEGRTLESETRSLLLSAWCSLTASWVAGATGHYRLKWCIVATGCVLLSRPHGGWPWPHSLQAAGTAAGLRAALPPVALLAFCVWPTLLGVLASTMFLVSGALPWRRQLAALLGGESTPKGAEARLSAPCGPPVSYNVALQDELEHLRRHAVEVEVQQLERGRTVGLGSYGKVVLVRHASSGTPYALKCLNRRLVVASGQQRAVARERAVMVQISHPFCARLVRSFKDAHAVYLLLEWCPGGELLRHLPRETGRGMAEPVARFYAACVSLALEHLHAQGIIYRDVKPENLLLDARGYLKLCDFGFAKLVGMAGMSLTVCGTPDFMAPEVIRGGGHGRLADVWSTGVLVYELVAGKPPFAERGSPTATVYSAILAHRAPLARLGDASDQLHALLCALLQEEASARLGALGWSEIKSHPWFDSVDWSALELRQAVPPIVPLLSGVLDTGNFEHFPDNAVALTDARPNDDEEAHPGCLPTRAGDPDEALFGDWDAQF